MSLYGFVKLRLYCLLILLFLILAPSAVPDARPRQIIAMARAEQAAPEVQQGSFSRIVEFPLDGGGWKVPEPARSQVAGKAFRFWVQVNGATPVGDAEFARVCRRRKLYRQGDETAFGGIVSMGARVSVHLSMQLPEKPPRVTLPNGDMIEWRDIRYRVRVEDMRPKSIRGFKSKYELRQRGLVRGDITGTLPARSEWGMEGLADDGHTIYGTDPNGCRIYFTPFYVAFEQLGKPVPEAVSIEEISLNVSVSYHLWLYSFKGKAWEKTARRATFGKRIKILLPLEEGWDRAIQQGGEKRAPPRTAPKVTVNQPPEKSPPFRRPSKSIKF